MSFMSFMSLCSSARVDNFLFTKAVVFTTHAYRLQETKQVGEQKNSGIIWIGSTFAELSKLAVSIITRRALFAISACVNLIAMGVFLGAMGLGALGSLLLRRKVALLEVSTKESLFSMNKVLVSVIGIIAPGIGIYMPCSVTMFNAAKKADEEAAAKVAAKLPKKKPPQKLPKERLNISKGDS